jgi:hypothetical protein
MKRYLTMFGQRFQRLVILVPLAVGACTSSESDFIGPRVLQTCDGTWAVCNTVVGCILGPEDYVSGSLPQSSGFIVTLGEPSTVTLSFFLSNSTAAGTQTTITFWEGGCRANIPFVIAGQEFLQEAQTQGQFQQQANLVDIGDHLIQYQSDARTDYLVKVDTVAQRSQ